MNLSTDPWIPIVWRTSEPGMVGLLDAFGRGEEIQDLALRPHERIAVMRLLICVTQAALDGPADYEEWKGCRPRIVPAAVQYLERWQHAFELLGDGPRFMQVKGQGKPGTMDLYKLDFVDADMTTLFDQDVQPGRKQTLEWTALHLVTYQSFAGGGTVGGSAVVEDRAQPQKGKNGPCRDSSAFHAFIRREDLVSTLHSNSVTKDSISKLGGLAWGTPVWEANAISLDGLQSTSATRSYLGRLAPISRAVWLKGDNSTASSSNGLEYKNYGETGIREPTMSVRVVHVEGTEQRVLLSAAEGDSIKKPWRELHALTVKRIGERGVGGPLALSSLDDNEPFDLWVGALVTDKAKVEDAVESTYKVPASMLKETIQLAYESGVRHAEEWEKTLRAAISTFRLAMETNEAVDRLPARLARLKGTERRRLGDIGSKACSSFWTLVEHRLDLLNRFALEPIPVREGTMQPWKTDWGMHVRRAALAAYKGSCPHETPRQIRAYALGLKVFFPAHAEEAEKEVEG